MNYLYNDGSGYVFMDNQNYEQMSLTNEIVGEAKDYLLENQGAIVAVYEGNPIYVELPASVVLEITFTEPGLQGDRSSGGTKPATVETGLQVQVPLFIEQNTKVRVDTRTGEYLGRVTD
jgi:elongation factor P